MGEFISHVEPLSPVVLNMDKDLVRTMMTFEDLAARIPHGLYL